MWNGLQGGKGGESEKERKRARGRKVKRVRTKKKQNINRTIESSSRCCDSTSPWIPEVIARRAPTRSPRASMLRSFSRSRDSGSACWKKKSFRGGREREFLRKFRGRGSEVEGEKSNAIASSSFQRRFSSLSLSIYLSISLSPSFQMKQTCCCEPGGAPKSGARRPPFIRKREESGGKIKKKKRT